MTSLRERLTSTARAATRGASLRRDRSTEPVANLHSLFPQLGKRATAHDMRTLARTLIVSGVRDEFTRDGLDCVDLPASWTRLDLLDAAIAEQPDYQRFVRVTLASLDLENAEVPSESDLAFALADDASADVFGATLETASSAATFLVARALDLEIPGHAKGHSDRGERLDAECRDLEKRAREQLTKMVTVPEELRQAVKRRQEADALQDSGANGTTRGTSSRASGSAQSDTDGGADAGAGAAFDGISMQDILRHAATVQAYLKTEQGRQVTALGASALALGRKYAKNRAKKPRS